MAIKFRMGALTDVGLVRSNNEDNYYATADLNLTAADLDSTKVYDLGDKGALMVVADGMGGMNAGEVASQIAVDTIKSTFTPFAITKQVLESEQNIVKFMNDAIVKADQKIKSTAAVNMESQGMGTTIVLAWILGDKLYVSWCGDSRAYIFNSEGLHQITRDHSYVQTLVDSGEITRDQAFDYPQSNVITRSLCDTLDAAVPENLYKPYPLANGDTIILCTDGVSGMLREKELENVIGSSSDEIDSLMANIKTAVQNRGASDNFTMCIAQIEDGALAVPDAAYFKVTEDMLDGKLPPIAAAPAKAATSGSKIPWKVAAIVGGVAVVAAVIAFFIINGNSDTPAISADEAVDVIQNTQNEPVATPAAATQTSAPAAHSNSSNHAPATPEKTEESASPAADLGGKISGSLNSGKTDEQQTEAEPAPSKPNPLNAITSGGGAAPQKPTTTEPTVPEPAPAPAPEPEPQNEEKVSPAVTPGK